MNRDWIEIRPDHKGNFDEIVARNVDLVHLEMMDDNCLWIRLDKGHDAQVVWIGVRGRSKLHITTEDDINDIDQPDSAPPAPGGRE